MIGVRFGSKTSEDLQIRCSCWCSRFMSGTRMDLLYLTVFIYDICRQVAQMISIGPVGDRYHRWPDGGAGNCRRLPVVVAMVLVVILPFFKRKRVCQTFHFTTGWRTSGISIIEAMRRKPIDREKNMVHAAGMFLLALMVFIMFNDVRKIIIKCCLRSGMQSEIKNKEKRKLMSRKDTKLFILVTGWSTEIHLIQSVLIQKQKDIKSNGSSTILSLEKAGCDIIRVAVPTMKAAEALKDIKKIHIR